MSETMLELIILEELDNSDEIHHAICSVCYPVSTAPMLSLCGVDISNEPIMPESEIINKCEECMKTSAHIGKNGKLHLMSRR